MVSDPAKKQTLQTLINIQNCTAPSSALRVSTLRSPPRCARPFLRAQRSVIQARAKQLDLPIDPMDGAEQQNRRQQDLQRSGDILRS